MSIDIERLRSELGTLAERPAPPSAVDLGFVQSRGRRVLARRRAASVLAVLGATVAVCALLVDVLPMHRGAPGPASVTSAGPAPSDKLAATASIAAEAGTDPLMATGTFGWLPEGMTVTAHDFGTDGVAITEATGGASITTMSSITLTVYRLGNPPTSEILGNGDTPHHATAPDVNGGSAYWVNPPRSGAATRDQDVMLRWRYAPAGWAELEFGTFASSGSEDYESIVYRVAKDVTVGKGTPVAMPVSLPVADVPAAVNDYGGAFSNTLLTGTSTGQTGWEADLTLQSPDSTGTSASSLQLRLFPASTDQFSSGATNTTVDGQKAYLAPIGSGTSPAAGEQLTVYRADGINLHLTLTGAWYLSLKPSGGALALYHQLTVLGTDPANWTTHVLVDQTSQ